MVSKEKLVPRLKFGGFKKDEWILEKVSDLANTTYGGGTPTTSVIEYWKGDIPWISSSDLEENKVHNVTPSRYITKEAINISATKLVPKNSIAIVTRVGVGKLALVPFEYTASQDFLSISNINGNELYSVYALYKLLQIVKNETQGTSIKGITKDKLLDKNIYIPTNIEEQIKIGTFFKKIDEMIQLQQSKVNKVKDIKSAYLSEMFPKEGEKYPKKRFEGLKNNWNQAIFSDFLKTESFKKYIAKNDRNGMFPIIQQGDSPIEGYGDGIPYKNYDSVVLFGDHTLSLFRPESPFLIASDGIKILSSNKMDRDYLYYLLQRYMPESEGYKRHYSILKNKVINITENKEEQIKIGIFFKNLDKQISIEEEKLIKLEKLKQAYLNDMFV